MNFVNKQLKIILENPSIIYQHRVIMDIVEYFFDILIKEVIEGFDAKLEISDNPKFKENPVVDDDIMQERKGNIKSSSINYKGSVEMTQKSSSLTLGEINQLNQFNSQNSNLNFYMYKSMDSSIKRSSVQISPVYNNSFIITPTKKLTKINTSNKKNDKLTIITEESNTASPSIIYKFHSQDGHNKNLSKKSDKMNKIVKVKEGNNYIVYININIFIF